MKFEIDWLGFIQILLIGLKLADKITWSWWVVLLPLLVSMICAWILVQFKE